MDMLVLLGGFCVLCLLGMPVAYALGLAAILAALWIDIPLEAVMLKISDGTDDFALLAIPFFVLAGGIMAEGGMATRLVNLAKVFVGFIRGGLALVNILASHLLRLHLGLVGRRHRLDRLGDDPADGQGTAIRALFATNVTICGSVQALLIPPSHNAVIYSLAAGGTISVAHLFLAGVIPGPAVRRCALMGLCFYIARARQLPEGRADPAAAGAQDRRRGALGPGHRRHHHRRHPVAASSRRPSRPRSPASTRSSSRCSSTATTSGASCRCWCTASSDGRRW